jgi:hypothetical protein
MCQFGIVALVKDVLGVNSGPLLVVGRPPLVKLVPALST